MSVTDLAARVGMTTQALGEFASNLERLGPLESVRDPTDGWARILRRTRRGRQVVSASNAAIGRPESAWSERLGADRWAQLRALLVRAAALEVRRRPARRTPPREGEDDRATHACGPYAGVAAPTSGTA